MRVTLTSMSLKVMENIQPSTKLSFFPRFISFIEGVSVQKYIEELI